MSNGDFWDEFGDAFAVESSIDQVLQGRTIEGSASTSVRALTDKERAKSALRVPVEAGTRVRFVANLGSVLTYDDVPGDGLEGTVVTVRTADGDTTHWQDRVMVAWDDGKFRPIMAEHLRRASPSGKKANAVRMVMASFDDLSTFFGPVRTSGKRRANTDLVHKATKDLWSFRKDGDQFVIERLFDEGGKPLKV